ncbi:MULTISPECIES: hypothetical protein [Streptomyces]|uniref:hypothetical protein n=1 Tax=Streptomyces TaxID=1883 RepID=UPI00163CA0D0|nr:MULTISPECIES: hypothetical protein [Streptomyces]MBC2873856.1 hypothetical protein [Streptomyces sp. TYQ1024]UBI39197.1 hypothetical protein K7I03_23895 [Streptomyces mobaraensis]UKW31779.1 hypothetical protein MCU78_23840 [Streptomyces sp. TYQ1024]
MEQQATAPRPPAGNDAPAGHPSTPSPVSPLCPLDIEQAEAAIVEHYPRLVRLGYLVLPAGLGRNRRVLTAHALVQRSLPRNRVSLVECAPDTVPGPRGPEERRNDDPGYAYVRLRVLRGALAAGRPRGRLWPPRPGLLPPPLPQVWGLRLFPRSGGADELALDQALGRLSPPARAAFVLRALELPTDREVRALLAAAGVAEPGAALSEAAAAQVPAGSRDGSLLKSAEFDPCSLQARPTDLMRRRQHLRAAAAALAATAVCGVLLAVPGGGWGPDGAAAPAYARNAAAEQALDPGRLTRAPADAWRRADRPGFASWPARGDRTDDEALLRRALSVWARPGSTVQVTATPGTPAGPAPGPPQLLYAGAVDSAVVVLLYDGLRVVRYAEPRNGDATAAALDFARTDAADADAATAVVLGRTDGNVRYLTAPWVASTAVRDLLDPAGAAQPLHRSADGVTDPTAGPAAAGDCRSWPVLQLGGRLVTDLGELVPARLTGGAPAPGPTTGDADTGAADRAVWAHTACLLPSLRSQGVRAVNAWRFARQPLPGGAGVAEWLCTRAETWRGAGSRAVAGFLTPGGRPAAQAAVVARAEDTPACGTRQPHALAGALWKSPGGNWYALAAGSPDIVSITSTGGVHGTGAGPALALPAGQGAVARLAGRTRDGKRVAALR